MCAYGMKIPDKYGNQFVYKPTKFMTNSPMVAINLERKCVHNHVHAQLSGSRTRKAATYPSQLIKAICKGIANQVKSDKFDRDLISVVHHKFDRDFSGTPFI